MENKTIIESVQVMGFKCHDCGSQSGMLSMAKTVVDGDDNQDERDSEKVECPDCGSQNTSGQLVVKS